MADANVPDDVNTITADDGTTWVEIASTGTEDEAKLLQGFLDAEGIPAQIEDVKFHMEPINFGTMGEIRIYVPRQHEERTSQLLREREREYEEHVDDDDDTLVTDDGVAELGEEVQVESDDGATS
jgi:hypothetical protein